MVRPSIPFNETERLRVLNELQILDTPPEADFTDVVRLALEICGMPIGLISFVDSNRQWFKAALGIDQKETARDIAFCAHTICDNEMLIVEDAFNL